MDRKNIRVVPFIVAGALALGASSDEYIQADGEKGHLNRLRPSARYAL